jgi:hypothetical protein
LNASAGVTDADHTPVISAIGLDFPPNNIIIAVCVRPGGEFE